MNAQKTHYSIFCILYVLIIIKIYQTFVKQIQKLTYKEYTYFQFSR